MRLIDADALKDCYGKWTDDHMEFVKLEIDGYVDMQPTIDPESLRPQWISVEDELPKNSTYVNVVTDGVVAQAYWRNDRFYAFTAIGVAQVGGVTHWMPLPEPEA